MSSGNFTAAGKQASWGLGGVTSQGIGWVTGASIEGDMCDGQMGKGQRVSAENWEVGHFSSP